MAKMVKITGMDSDGTDVLIIDEALLNYTRR